MREEDVPTIIGEIVEETGLKNIEEKKIEEAFAIIEREGDEGIEKAKRILDELPSSKIAKILAEILYQNSPIENLSQRLKEELNLDLEKTQILTQKLKERIFNQKREGFFEEKEPEIKTEEVFEILRPEIKEKRRFDPYREPIEEEPQKDYFDFEFQKSFSIEKELKTNDKELLKEEPESFPEIKIQKREIPTKKEKTGDFPIKPRR
ncbi:hypothetical protein H5T58_00005, partial [Candidatus Parcubacteria bacterium]|nr:hypothetical protein [Candidatus Parcubacteria bacterium]